MRMTKLAVAVGIALAASIAPAAIAQTVDMVKASAPGKAGVAQTIKATATITKIDAATRAVSLKGADGHETTVIAGPEVKNFANMKVGDQVNVEYIEALTLELKKGGKAPVARTEEKGKASAKPGEAPAGAIGRQVKITADVVAVDAAKHTVSLKGPNRTVDLNVRDPEQLKLIKVGDQVEATYTEAVAVAVVPVPAAPAKPAPAPAKEAPKK
jgi:Cu/Ag efflux protein CusF